MNRTSWTLEQRAEFRRLAGMGMSAIGIARKTGRSLMAVYAHGKYYRIPIKRIGDGGYAARRGRDLLWDRLAWVYGPDRASLIMEGRDPKTQADLGAWRSLGRRSAA